MQWCERQHSKRMKNGRRGLVRSEKVCFLTAKQRMEVEDCFILCEKQGQRPQGIRMLCKLEEQKTGGTGTQDDENITRMNLRAMSRFCILLRYLDQLESSDFTRAQHDLPSIFKKYSLLCGKYNGE